MMYQIKYFTSILILCEVGFARSQTISLEPRSERNNSVIIHKDTINKCPEIESVNLSQLGLKNLSNKLIKSEKIKSLSFEDNDLARVPSTILNSVPNLECLNFANNRISYEQLDISHANLKTLILDYQRLSEIDDLLFNTCTDSSEGKITLPSLQSFSWRGAKTNCIYFRFSSFPKLTSIDLSGTILDLMSINVSIDNGNLDMKNIYMRNNDIKFFNLDNFQNVETLYLDENPLIELSAGMYHQKLKLLSLTGCSLYEVPTAIYSDSLHSLDLSRNKITTTNGAFKFTPNIENLDLSYNNLKTIPTFEHLYRLRKLSLSNNFIAQITHNIMLSNLTFLSLRNNKITYISSSSFGMLEELQELDLSNNELTSLPREWHEGMKTLRYLNVENNKFLRIADMRVDMISNLKELYIGRNGVKTIDIYELQKIPSECVLYVL